MGIRVNKQMLILIPGGTAKRSGEQIQGLQLWDMMVIMRVKIGQKNFNVDVKAQTNHSSAFGRS